MRSIKTHFGVIISLIALLFSIQFGFFINNITKSYEKSIQNEYNIVLASKKILNLEEIQKTIGEIESLTPINTDTIVEKMQNKISQNSLEELRKTLPKFYNVKLSFFPNSNELADIENRLKTVGNITKVEIFKKTHDDILRVLLLLKSLVYGFAFLIVILGIMLIYKQMRIWVFEHKERIEIMDIFGAPYSLKSSRLYKMALTDSFIATFIVVLFYYLLPYWEVFMKAISEFSNLDYAINLFVEAPILFIISIFLSLVAVTLVMIEIRRSK